jgi:hypothetical protein
MDARPLIPLEISIMTPNGPAEETFYTQVFEYPVKGDTATFYTGGYYGLYEILGRLHMFSHADGVSPRVICKARFLQEVEGV